MRPFFGIENWIFLQQLKCFQRRNFEEKNLRRMIQFASQFTDLTNGDTVTTFKLESFFSPLATKK
jgi:hypothetical protein